MRSKLFQFTRLRELTSDRQGLHKDRSKEPTGEFSGLPVGQSPPPLRAEAGGDVCTAYLAEFLGATD